MSFWQSNPTKLGRICKSLCQKIPAKIKRIHKLTRSLRRPTYWYTPTTKKPNMCSFIEQTSPSKNLKSLLYVSDKWARQMSPIKAQTSIWEILVPPTNTKALYICQKSRTCDLHLCDMTQMCMCVCVVWLMHTCGKIHSHVWHDVLNRYDRPAMWGR